MISQTLNQEKSQTSPFYIGLIFIKGISVPLDRLIRVPLKIEANPESLELNGNF